uniref:Amino acid transporter n=1 Tax=Acrobeloides nanus TaxID=290746 RepID=A0A914EIN1_9BILA
MVIIPLIAASLISGLSQLDAKQSGKIGAFAFFYYGLTTSLAVITGIAFVLLIHPGDKSIKQQNIETSSSVNTNISTIDKFLDIFRNMFPENIIRATFQQQETNYKQVQVVVYDNGGNISYKLIDQPISSYVDGMNVLGIIVFCIAVGIAISYIGTTAKPLMDLFIALDHVITAIVNVIMWYSPIGIASLIAAKILQINDLSRTAQSLGLYMATVMAGLAVHIFITLPLIYFVTTRKNPYKYLKGLIQVAMTAIGTASSAASLPVNFRCLEENNGIDPKYTKFVLPIGATVNMDGTALYEAVASIFIAQLNGRELGIGEVIVVSLTATLASIGAASIPSAGLVTMLIVLTAVGLPTDDISMIVAVDWLLDRFRTAVNVCGDAFGCGFVQHLCEGSNFSYRIKPKELPLGTLLANSYDYKSENGTHNSHISQKDDNTVRIHVDKL